MYNFFFPCNAIKTAKSQRFSRDNALYQKEDVQRYIQPTTKATTLNVRKVKMIRIYAFIQHMHTSNRFFSFCGSTFFCIF